MGKLSLKKQPVSTNQSKISHFFQKSCDKKTSLFTELKATGSTKSCSSSDSIDLTDENPSETQLQLRQIRQKEAEYFNNQVLQDDTKSRNCNTMGESSNENGRIRPRLCDMTNKFVSNEVVLETQFDDSIDLTDNSPSFCQTPDFTKCKNKLSSKNLHDISSDFIPDTPDPLDSSGRKKHEYSRSFLKSSSVIIDGIKKVPPRTKLRAKRLSHSGGPVSISFSKNTTSSNITKSHEYSFDKSDTESPSLIGLKYTTVLNNQLTESFGSTSEAFKRGAQKGLSPDPKRLLSNSRPDSHREAMSPESRGEKITTKSKRRLCTEMIDTIVAVNDNEILQHQSKHDLYANRVECSNEIRNEDFSCESEILDNRSPDDKEVIESKSVQNKSRFKMPHARSNDYQLNMVKTRVSPNSSVKDDDILSDILNEMNTSDNALSDASMISNEVKKVNKSPFSLKKKAAKSKISHGSVDDMRCRNIGVNEENNEVKFDQLTDKDFEMLRIMESVTGNPIETTGVEHNIESTVKVIANSKSSNEFLISETNSKNINSGRTDCEPKIEDYSDEFSADFDECLLDDLDLCERKETKTRGNGKILSSLGRHVVTGVDQHTDKLVLHLTDSTGQNKTCHLEGFWSDTRIRPNDIVNILDASWTNGNCCYITDKAGLIVVNPDLLISGTSVVGSIRCMRQTVLNDAFKGCDSESVIMLYGSIVHEFFQTGDNNTIAE